MTRANSVCVDANGNPFYAKEVLYSWHMGAAVKDFRYNARIANIEHGKVLSATSTFGRICGRHITASRAAARMRYLRVSPST